MILKSEIRNPKSEKSFKYFNFGNFKFVSGFVLCASCLLVLTIPLTVFAEGFVPLAGVPGLTKGATANTEGLALFFNNLYKFLIGIAATLAVIEIIWGGLEISTKDSVVAQGDGKKRIEQAILGLVLVLSPVLVFSLINPSILNLSLNIPKIDLSTAPGAGGTGSGTGTTVIVDPESKCDVNGVSGILQVATCPSTEAAQKWGTGCNPALDDLSSITTFSTTNSTTGIKTTTTMVTCTSKQYYVFIDTEPFLSFWVNAVKPVAKTNSSQGRTNNGNDALSFVSICRAANPDFQTCLVGGEAKASPITPCPIDPPRAGLAWKCYQRTLSCSYSPVSNTLSGTCSKAPSWTIFQ